MHEFLFQIIIMAHRQPNDQLNDDSVEYLESSTDQLTEGSNNHQESQIMSRQEHVSSGSVSPTIAVRLVKFLSSSALKKKENQLVFNCLCIQIGKTVD